jgi:2-dehydropantoate 2-reductase
MRIGVLGAGAVGGAIAALLHRAGHDVEVAARGAHLAAIRESGIRLTGGWGEHVARVSAEETLTRPAELVVVATKAQDAVAAIRDSIGLLRGIPVVVVQNGLDGIEAAVAASPRSDIVGGLALFASSYLSPGRIDVTAAGPLVLGVGDGVHDVPARFAATVLGDALPTEVVPDFRGAQWSKLVINQVNALPAITGLSVQEVVADARLRRVLSSAIRETARVGFAAGVRFAPLQGITNRLMRAAAAAPLSVVAVLPRLMARRMGAVPNPGSTLQSIRRGVPTEVDALNGAVVRAAERAGRRAPVNAAMVALVHEVEADGRFRSADEVVARVAQQRSR